MENPKRIENLTGHQRESGRSHFNLLKENAQGHKKSAEQDQRNFEKKERKNISDMLDASITFRKENIEEELNAVKEEKGKLRVIGKYRDSTEKDLKAARLCLEKREKLMEEAQSLLNKWKGIQQEEERNMGLEMETGNQILNALTSKEEEFKRANQEYRNSLAAWETAGRNWEFYNSVFQPKQECEKAESELGKARQRWEKFASEFESVESKENRLKQIETLVDFFNKKEQEYKEIVILAQKDVEEAQENFDYVSDKRVIESVSDPRAIGTPASAHKPTEISNASKNSIKEKKPENLEIQQINVNEPKLKLLDTNESIQEKSKIPLNSQDNTIKEAKKEKIEQPEVQQAQRDVEALKQVLGVACKTLKASENALEAIYKRLDTERQQWSELQNDLLNAAKKNLDIEEELGKPGEGLGTEREGLKGNLQRLVELLVGEQKKAGDTLTQMQEEPEHLTSEQVEESRILSVGSEKGVKEILETSLPLLTKRANQLKEVIKDFNEINRYLNNPNARGGLSYGVSMDRKLSIVEISGQLNAQKISELREAITELPRSIAELQKENTREPERPITDEVLQEARQDLDECVSDAEKILNAFAKINKEYKLNPDLSGSEYIKSNLFEEEISEAKEKYGHLVSENSLRMPKDVMIDMLENVKEMGKTCDDIDAIEAAPPSSGDSISSHASMEGKLNTLKQETCHLQQEFIKASIGVILGSMARIQRCERQIKLNEAYRTIEDNFKAIADDKEKKVKKEKVNSTRRAIQAKKVNPEKLLNSLKEIEKI